MYGTLATGLTCNSKLNEHVQLSSTTSSGTAANQPDHPVWKWSAASRKSFRRRPQGCWTNAHLQRPLYRLEVFGIHLAQGWRVFESSTTGNKQWAVYLLLIRSFLLPYCAYILFHVYHDQTLKLAEVKDMSKIVKDRPNLYQRQGTYQCRARELGSVESHLSNAVLVTYQRVFTGIVTLKTSKAINGSEVDQIMDTLVDMITQVQTGHRWCIQHFEAAKIHYFHISDHLTSLLQIQRERSLHSLGSTICKWSRISSIALYRFHYQIRGTVA